MTEPRPAIDATIAVERSLVGALLIRPDVAPVVFAVLTIPEAFTTPELRRAFGACYSLHRRGEDITTPNLLREYDTRGWDRGGYFETLTHRLPENDRHSNDEAEGYARAVLDGWQLRRYRDRAKSATSIADFRALAELVQSTEETPARTDRISNQVAAFLDRQHAVWEGRHPEGYSWGLDCIDAYMLMAPGRTYGIAASKGHGKTWAMAALVDTNLRDGVPVLVFSCEMAPVDLLARIIAHRLGIDSSIIHTQEMDSATWAKVERAAHELKTNPLQIDGRSLLTTLDIGTAVGAWKRSHDIGSGEGLVCLDFVQRVASERSGHADTIYANQAAVAYELTEVAKRHGVAILELIQTNKTGETQRAHMSQVDGSGAYTQALDGLVMLEMPNAKSEHPVESDGTAEEMNITIPKNRHGAPRFHPIKYTADLSIGLFREQGRVTRGRVLVGR